MTPGLANTFHEPIAHGSTDLFTQDTSDDNGDELQSDLLSVEVELFSEGNRHFHNDGYISIAECDGMSKCRNKNAGMRSQRERRNNVQRSKGSGADLSWNQLTPEPGCLSLVLGIVDRFISDGKVHQELAEVDDSENPEDPLDTDVLDHETHEEWAGWCTDGGHQRPPADLLATMLRLA